MSATPRVPMGRYRRLGLSGLTLAALLAIAPPAQAQGPLRRLGDRIRERAGGPLLPGGPVQPRADRSAGSLPSTPLGRAAAGKPAVPPTAKPPANLPLQSVDSARSANFRRPTANPPAAPQPGARPGIGASAASSDSWAKRTPPEPPTPGNVASASGDAASNLGRLGLTVGPPATVTNPGLPPRRLRGAEISSVQPNSPAAAAGLQPGDRVVAIDGRLVNSVDDLLRQLDRWEPNRKWAVQVSREDRLETLRLAAANPDANAGGAATAANRPNPGQATGGNRSILGGFGAALGGLLGSRTQPAEAAGEVNDAAGGASGQAAAVAPLDTAPLEVGQPEPIAAPLPEPRVESDEVP